MVGTESWSRSPDRMALGVGSQTSIRLHSFRNQAKQEETEMKCARKMWVISLLCVVVLFAVPGAQAQEPPPQEPPPPPCSPKDCGGGAVVPDSGENCNGTYN